MKDNGARLVIESCQLSDSGEYTCTASTGGTPATVLGGTAAAAGRTVKLVLEVSRVPVPPSQPRIQVIKL